MTETYTEELAKVDEKVRFRRAVSAFDQTVPDFLKDTHQPTPAQARWWAQAYRALDGFMAREDGAHDGVMLMGPQGRGKTSLMVKLLKRSAFKYGVVPQYLNMAMVSYEVKDARRRVNGARSHTEILNATMAAGIIAIDDIGYSDTDDRDLARAIIQNASDAGKFLVLAGNITESHLWDYLGADAREKSRLYNALRIMVPNSVPDHRMSRAV